MQDAPAIMADDKETVENAERDRWHCEEVHRCNRFLVILKKWAPTFDWLGISKCPLHPAEDGSLDANESNEPVVLTTAGTGGTWRTVIANWRVEEVVQTVDF